MSVVSFAQNLEDVMLWRALKHIENGFYIDVGAHHPTVDSVTKLFYDMGWRGINIEPISEWFELLRVERFEDVNIQAAAGSETSEINIYEVCSTGLSTTIKEIAEEHKAKYGFDIKKHTVLETTLDEICKEHPSEDIHFLKIDVEGGELSVINGFDLEKYRPWIIVIEATKPLSQEESFEDYEKILTSNNYTYVYADGLNRFYVAKEHSELEKSFVYPPNINDDFILSGSANNSQHRQIHASILREKSAEENVNRLNGEKDALVQTIGRRDQAIQQCNLTINEKKQIIKEQDFIIKQQKQKISKQDVEMAEINNRLSSVEEELKYAQDENASLRRLNDKIKTALSDRTDEFNLTHVRLGNTVEQLAFTNKELQDVYRSKSWRLTYPLRRTFFHLRNIRNKFKEVLPTPKKTAGKGQGLGAKPPAFVAPVLPECEDVSGVLSNGKPVYYIYVDHTVAFAANSGVQRVVRGISRGLLNCNEIVRFVKWDSAKKTCVLINKDEFEHLSKWNGPQLNSEEASIYSNESVTEITSDTINKDDWLVVAEVPHITPHECPVTLNLLSWARGNDLKSGYVFYDATPLKREELKEMRPLHSDYMEHLLLADTIWPISQYSADDLISFFYTNEKCDGKTIPNIKTIPLTAEVNGVDRITEKSKKQKIILSVGSIDTHKNQELLIKAFDKYTKENQDTEWQLILVGSINPEIQKRTAGIVEKNSLITITEHVTDEKLYEYYKSCTFTVFPSVAEGFGLPILESLWFAKPCVCANFGAMGEIAQGGGCHMIDTKDQGAIEKAIKCLIDDEEYLDELVQQAVTRDLRTWKNYVDDICENMAEESSPLKGIGNIYYPVDSTSTLDINTGIQRVTRQLARSLQEIGANLIPVRWNHISNSFEYVDEHGLEILSKWNGPDPSLWGEWIEPSPDRLNDWVLQAELTSNLEEEQNTIMNAYFHRNNLKTGMVFYDAIPCKMDSIYSQVHYDRHSRYMMNSAHYNLIFPISQFSADDYLDHVGGNLMVATTLDQKVKTCLLPGEFLERERIYDLTVRNKEKIRILSVGTVEPRKNHEKLLEAFQIVTSRTDLNVELVIVGGENALDPALTERVNHIVNVNPNIIWEKKVDDERLNELMLSCDFTVYPSMEEGFGMPILESIWYGKPCICGDRSSMAEVAVGGACLTVDVTDANLLANAIQYLVEDASAFYRLAKEAINRPLKLWEHYGQEILGYLQNASTKIAKPLLLSQEDVNARSKMMNLQKRPKLSVCISTYNHADLLAASLRVWAKLYPEPVKDVEFVVCDNTSTDHTPEVVKPYLKRKDFSYHRNFENVGMLGNLRETAFNAKGEYIWILGDDDIMFPGVIERIMEAIETEEDLSMVYLNYAYTNEEDPVTLDDYEDFLKRSTPVTPPQEDFYGSVRDVSSKNGNVFTAIYTLVVRRDHALQMYSQNTNGMPFSTMKTCIPTTYYALHYMMDEKAKWLAAPQLVVNLNVSWEKYAPIWILERLQEAFDIAELNGASQHDISQWRQDTVGGVLKYFDKIYKEGPDDYLEQFSPSRMIRRFKHLPRFQEHYPALEHTYNHYHHTGHKSAIRPTKDVFKQPLS